MVEDGIPINAYKLKNNGMIVKKIEMITICIQKFTSLVNVTCSMPAIGITNTEEINN